VTQPVERSILFLGNDPALEYLLKRYARQSRYEIRSLREFSPEIDVRVLHPQSVWFSSLEVLEASQRLRSAIANADIPIVVCSSVADDARAVALGADYFFLQPVTYDCFLSTLAGTNRPQVKKK